MEEKCPVLVGEIMVDVEQKSVEGVFEDCPDDITGKKAPECLGESIGGRDGEVGEREGEKLACSYRSYASVDILNLDHLELQNTLTSLGIVKGIKQT